MMEAARTSETLVNFYQSTRCYNPGDSNLHTHRRENLKSYTQGCISNRCVITANTTPALDFIIVRPEGGPNGTETCCVE
jgi:hypothetical protein